MRKLRYALPLLAVVAIAVGAACTPVKQQFGKNILAFNITNGCLPGLPEVEPANGFRSPSNNFSREVCSGGFAGHTVGANGVTMQVVNDTGPLNRSGVSFVTGGLNQLGAINALKVSMVPGSSPVGAALVLDKNGDGTFLCPPGQNGFCGDAIAQFNTGVNGGSGGEHVWDNPEPMTVLFGPCGAFPPGCVKTAPFGPSVTLGELKQGKLAGIDGFTPAVIAVSLSAGNPLTGPAPPDRKTVVTGVEVNGMQFLP